MDKKAIGRKIQSIRLNLGMNTREFGEEIFNSSDSLVSRWEKGKSVPRQDRLKRIAELGNITVDELVATLDYQSLYEQEKQKNIKNDARIIGQRIKNIRRSKGLSMREFGEYFGAQSGVVSNWENAKQTPNRKRLKQIAEFAGITVEELTDSIDYKQLYELECNRAGSLQNEIDNLKLQIDLLKRGD